MKYNELNLSEELKELFDKYNIDYANGNDVSNSIQQVNQRTFFERLTFILNTLFKMRYTDGIDDYILSPVPNVQGVCFDSRNVKDNAFPIDGDAKWCVPYCAKGLQRVKEIQTNSEKPKMVIKQDEWFKFVKEKAKRTMV